ncbi:hypothetical protein AVEN_139583-1 [Araneus ventricosus]|uniref:Uncharacterized protein n=1 Tax=Araneus ventricosus TaxID=182803 RepID=A0A4Y2LL87_ARAVE|nr:hypothetical protein AVEN_139583-1 [Araneus ventricosus]
MGNKAASLLNMTAGTEQLLYYSEKKHCHCSRPILAVRTLLENLKPSTSAEEYSASLLNTAGWAGGDVRENEELPYARLLGTNIAVKVRVRFAGNRLHAAGMTAEMAIPI